MLVIPTRSWGTFGVWGALLSGGLSMYPVAAQIYGVGTSYVQYVLFCTVGWVFRGLCSAEGSPCTTLLLMSMG